MALIFESVPCGKQPQHDQVVNNYQLFTALEVNSGRYLIKLEAAREISYLR